VLSATNTPLEQAVHDGKFRRDLFFRLQVVEIQAPPLRDRKEDIPLLAEHFLRRFIADVGRRVKGFTAAAFEKMQDYNWPGNVRELRNVVERAVALGTGSMLDSHDILLSALDDKITSASGIASSFKTMTLEELERRHIVEVLVYTDWNKTQAASLLGIERSTLDRKIRAYELRKAD
jgi:Nif-specific regulatory protein